MPKRKVLLAGESWVSSSTHYKGFDQFGSVSFHLGAGPLVKALKDTPFELVYMPAHEAAEGFPFTAAGLAEYEAIILSDIGSNTFLLPPAVWMQGKPMPNRLKVIRDWTRAGGGLMMIGGYLSFQGIDGRARWRGTPVEEALPVTCHPYDDRVEVPEGFVPEIVGEPDNPILRGLGRDWPLLLGANEGDGCGPAPISRCWPSCRRRKAATLCSSAGHFGAWPHPGLDLRHRAALGAGHVRAMGGLRTAMDQRADLADGRRLGVTARRRGRPAPRAGSARHPR